MLSASYLSLITGVLLAVILAYMQRTVIAAEVISAWLGLTLLVGLGRAVLFGYYKFAPAHGAAIVAARLLKFRIGVLCAGLVWGCASYWMFPAQDPQHQMFFVFLLAGLTAGAVISFASDIFSATAYAVLILVPLVLRLFFSHENGSLAMSIAVSLYLIFMLLTLRYLHKNITENFTLRFAAVAREATVRASEERYRLLLEHTPAGILHYDRDLRVTFCNNRFAEILHNSSENLIGIDMNTLKDQSALPALQAALAGEIGRYEGQYLPTYSEVKNWIDLTCAPSRDEQGNIVGGIGILQDTSERRSSADTIRNLAFYDSLTALPNRRLLTDRLHHAAASSLRHRNTGALLFIDLDNFKTLNDNLGHEIGDRLLQEVAKRLLLCVRQGDTVARVGGDEFVVILEDLSDQAQQAAEQTEFIGEKILAALHQSYWFSAHEYHSSASIGVALFNSRERGIDTLMQQADIAMYQAKKSGRNSLRFFDPEMQEVISARALLENELRKAMSKQQFLLHYQVQVDDAYCPSGAEVLLRWMHPQRGLLSPDEFINLAEETGLILPIGQWVLDAACEQLQSWQNDAKLSELVLSVNISAKQFHQLDFVAQIHSAVQHYAINPARLKLEITEGMLLENIEDVISKMNALKNLGIRFALDDFGTGFSSLQYLKRLPLSQIKIDQSFVRDLAIDNSDKVIVRTIITMAQSMNIEVIAEGVETEQQRLLLLSKGCKHFQGYLFGQPLPVMQFEAAFSSPTNSEYL